MSTNIFGDNLRTRRRELGWSQTEAAKRLNTTPRSLANYESSIAEPSISMLKAITETYGIDDLYLFITKKLPQTGIVNGELVTIN